MKLWLCSVLVLSLFSAGAWSTCEYSSPYTYCCCDSGVSVINGECSCDDGWFSSSVSTPSSIFCNIFINIHSQFIPALSTMLWNCMPKYALLCNSFNHSLPNQNFRNHRHLCNQFIPS